MITLVLATVFHLNAQAALGLDADERPVTGGIERGIGGWDANARAKSPYFYFVAVLGQNAIDWSRPTHVIATGHGQKSGTLFQIAAASRGKKYAETFPQHQIILIAVNELDGDQNLRKLEAWGYHVVQARGQMLGVRRLIDELKPLARMVSFDLYAHSNQENGAALDQDYMSKFSYELNVWSRKFTPDAWASIHGCNSGWNLAPSLAKRWGVPVSGSYTGTHFQRLHTAGDFYPYDTQLAPPGPWAPTNPLSFTREQDCLMTGCVRMHPDPYRYWGEWGIAEHGLGFYRFACGPLAADVCERRMVGTFLGFLGKTNFGRASGEPEFRRMLAEYMCPINRDLPVRADCERGIEAALANGDDTYTPFPGKSSVCAGDECRAPEVGETSTAFMDAIKSYLRGFRLSRASATKTR